MSAFDNRYHINGVMIWYYYICKREVWLMARHIEPWQDNSFIEIGRIISEQSYKRDKKEIHIENIVIDLLKTEEGDVIIGEVKKSSTFKESAKMQLAFYLMRLKELGINAKGELLFPKEKKKIKVILTTEIEQELIKAKNEIIKIINMEKPPVAIKNKFCLKCGYREFCWS